MRDLLSKLDRALARLDLVEIQLWVLDAWRAAVVLSCIVAVALLFVRRGSVRSTPPAAARWRWACW